MSIDSSTTKLLEGMRKLQFMLQSSKNVSAAEKLESQKILSECEDNLFTVMGNRLGTTYSGGKEKVEGFSSSELVNKVSSVAYDMNKCFTILQTLPALKKTQIDFFRPRPDEHKVQNKFTKKTGKIRAEVGNDKELFYLIQYDDGTYNLCAEISAQLL